MPKIYLKKHYPFLIFQTLRLSKENYIKFAYLNIQKTYGDKITPDDRLEINWLIIYEENSKQL